MAQRPFTVIAAAALEALEGAAALGFGVFVGWETVVGKPLDPATATSVTALALLGGACMLAVARGLLRADRWSRSPAVLTQLFALPVSWSLLQSEQYFFGVPLIVAAVLALGLLLSPPSTAWLVGLPEDPADPEDPAEGSAEPAEGSAQEAEENEEAGT